MASGRRAHAARGYARRHLSRRDARRPGAAHRARHLSEPAARIWRGALRQLGAEYAAFADVPSDHDTVFSVVEERWRARERAEACAFACTRACGGRRSFR